MQLLEKTLLTETILEITLQAPDDFEHQAGQYILFGLTEDELKPFSIANAPNENHTLILQIKDHIHSDWMQQLFALELGSGVIVQGPNDQYPPLPSSGELFLIAGGTGFSPLSALLDASLAQSTQAHIRFYWGAQQAAELYHHAKMLDLAQTNDQVDYTPVVSEPDATWEGEMGLVHLKALETFKQLTPEEQAQTHVYLCGPWPMREQAKTDFLAAGLAEPHFL